MHYTTADRRAEKTKTTDFARYQNSSFYFSALKCIANVFYRQQFDINLYDINLYEIKLYEIKLYNL